MKFWTVNAFANTPFSGNPAAVTLIEDFPSTETCQKMAAEMNLPAMAFVKPLATDHFHIRWFTPGIEAKLCGHATLATAHILFEEGIVEGNQVVFDSFSGPLSVQKKQEEIILDLPLQKAGEPLPFSLFQDLFDEDFFVNAVKAYDDIIVELRDERLIRELNPNFEKVKKIDCRSFIVTAKGSAPYDFVSRVFAPRLGVNEDPVCGSAHGELADYWSDRIGKKEFLAYQASERGGILGINIMGDRVHLRGKAVTIMEGSLRIPQDIIS